MIDELNSRNEQLIQAKKLASLGRLTSGVAHELNNPLNNISTSLQILIEELEEENLEYKRDLLIGAEQEVVRGKNIVRALLEFSRERSFEMKWINFKDLVHNAIKRIKAMLPDNVTIKVDVPDDIQVYGGPDPIERVLINLFDNAVQAMEDGGEITITAFPREATNDRLCLQVQDNGSGIPEEDLGRIFDPFYSTKEVGKGSGLGLSIVYGIIEQHGGEISVTSKEGKGTTFSVYFPNRPL